MFIFETVINSAALHQHALTSHKFF